MVGRVWRVVAVVCLCACAAAAQDPTKVEPKHYRLQFENEHVQVVNVHYGPHEKSEMHDHPGGVVVVVTGGHLRFTDQSGKVTDVYSKAGEARWFPPFKHRVENVGDEAYNAVYIGIKKGLTAKAGSAPEPPGGAQEVTPEVAQPVAAALMELGKNPAKP